MLRERSFIIQSVFFTLIILNFFLKPLTLYPSSLNDIDDNNLKATTSNDKKEGFKFTDNDEINDGADNLGHEDNDFNL